MRFKVNDRVKTCITGAKSRHGYVIAELKPDENGCLGYIVCLDKKWKSPVHNDYVYRAIFASVYLQPE